MLVHGDGPVLLDRHNVTGVKRVFDIVILLITGSMLYNQTQSRSQSRHDAERGTVNISSVYTNSSLHWSQKMTSPLAVLFSGNLQKALHFRALGSLWNMPESIDQELCSMQEVLTSLCTNSLCCMANSSWLQATAADEVILSAIRHHENCLSIEEVFRWVKWECAMNHWKRYKQWFDRLTTAQSSGGRGKRMNEYLGASQSTHY